MIIIIVSMLVIAFLISVILFQEKELESQKQLVEDLYISREKLKESFYESRESERQLEIMLDACCEELRELRMFEAMIN